MKHTNTVMQQYCRAVRKKLPLPARQRRQLLAGLQEELAESAPDCATLDALITQFGTPEETAQELLLTTEQTLAEITEECGFGSASYLAKLFRSVYSATPQPHPQ